MFTESKHSCTCKAYIVSLNFAGWKLNWFNCSKRFIDLNCKLVCFWYEHVHSSTEKTRLSAFETIIISFISLNVRGLKNSIKRKAIFLFCKDQKSQCVFLQETHSVRTDEKFWKIQWGDYAFFAHGTSYSAGVMILFNRFPGSIIDHKEDTEGHWLYRYNVIS